MGKKLKTNIKFSFEDLGDMVEFNVPVNMSEKSKPIKIVNLVKHQKPTKDASTRLF